MFRTFFISLLVLTCFTTVAMARSQGDPPDMALSIATSNPATVLVVPSGTGETLAEKNATIQIILYDAVQMPIPNYPWQDIWLGDPGTGTLTACSVGAALYGLHADANTDVNGMTTISGALPGGGSTFVGSQVYVIGMPLLGPPLQINFVSCDMNGDLRVDVADVGEFAIAFSGPDYRPEADFSTDGVLDIADVGILATHIGSSCP